MANNNFKFEDYSKLLKKFDSLSDAVQKKHAWGAVKRGAHEIQKQAKRNMAVIDDPETEVNISKFIIVQRATKIAKATKASAAYRVGVAGGAVFKNGQRVPPTYWRFLELGTEDTLAQPFLGPSAVQAAGAAVEAIAKSLEERIDKEAEKK